jgi:hypothetical protein
MLVLELVISYGFLKVSFALERGETPVTFVGHGDCLYFFYALLIIVSWETGVQGSQITTKIIV